jgi:hypothetical protein
MSPMQSKTNTAAAAPKAAISLAPSSFVAGGGLLNDEDVTITDAAFSLWDYQGKSAVQVPALGIEFTDADGKAEEQYYSCGKIDHFVPSEDGKSLVPVADKTAISNQANAALFLGSLVNAGLPEDILAAGDITRLVGAKVHVQRVPQPKRSTDDPGAKAKEILVVTKILALPGETGKPKGLTKAGTAGVKPNGAATKTTAPAPVAAAAAADTSELDTATTEAVIEVLGANDGTVALKALPAKIFAASKGNPLQKQMMKRSIEEDFIATAGDGLFTFDGTNVSLA